jgi:hypothetical protein
MSELAPINFTRGIPAPESFPTDDLIAAASGVLQAHAQSVLARIEGSAGEASRARARAIAVRLGDDELLARVDRQDRQAPAGSG